MNGMRRLASFERYMHRRPLIACAVVAAYIFIVGIASARAQTPAPSPSPSELTEIGRVTTSDRRPEPIDRTSRPTFVITRAHFEAEGARTVGEALALVPGIPTFSDYYGFGTVSNYGIRGARSAQTLVLLDGVPIVGASSGTIDLGTYPLTGIQRIEVVESGGSTLYGTSAVGGIINLITAPQRGTNAMIAGGSYADRDVRFVLGDGKIGAEFERHVVNNAFSFPALSYPQMPFAAGVRTNSWAQQSAFRANLDEPLGGLFSFRADLGLDAIGGGVPGRLDFLTPLASQRIARDSATFEISRNGPHSVLSLSAAAARQGLVYLDPDPNDCGGESDTYDGRAQFSLKDVMSSERSTLVTGIDLSRESALFSFCPAFAPPAGFGAAEAQAAVYAQEQWTLTHNAQLLFGLRGENDAPRGSVLAPAFGAVFHFGALRLAGNVAESFRVPSLTDLYYPGFSNPDLAPEKARNFDVTLAAANLPGDFSLGWFGRDGSNFIVLDQNFVPQNIGRASVAGLMLTAKSPSFAGMTAEANLTDLYRALDLVANARLPRTPVMQASIGLTRPFGASNVAFGLHTNVVGGTYAAADAPFGFPPAYDASTTLDGYLRLKLARNAIVTARVRNLGDARYAPVAGYPAVGRTIAVELSTR